MPLLSAAEKRYAGAFLIISLIPLGFLALRFILTGTTRYFFIAENLALAWTSLFFTWLLLKRLKVKRWLSWQNVAISFLWVIFLPNTWYVLTDFIHVRATGEISQLFDVVLMGSLAMCGFGFGFTSLYLVHREMERRLSPRKSWLLISFVILLASFAIYLGRDLRWNSWDVVKTPGGLILNISDRVVDPLGQLRALNVTSMFFVLITATHIAIRFILSPIPKR